MSQFVSDAIRKELESKKDELNLCLYFLGMY